MSLKKLKEFFMMGKKQAKKAADVNKDGKVDSKDAKMAKEKAVKSVKKTASKAKKTTSKKK